MEYRTDGYAAWLTDHTPVGTLGESPDFIACELARRITEGEE